MQVTEVASGNGLPVFDMQGESLAGLEATADKACPHGHSVLRRWQGGQTTTPDANIADRAWFQTQRLIGEAGAKAQLVVQCLPPAAEAPAAEATWTAPVDAGAPKSH